MDSLSCINRSEQSYNLAVGVISLSVIALAAGIIATYGRFQLAYQMSARLELAGRATLLGAGSAGLLVGSFLFARQPKKKPLINNEEVARAGTEERAPAAEAGRPLRPAGSNSSLPELIPQNTNADKLLEKLGYDTSPKTLEELAEEAKTAATQKRDELQTKLDNALKKVGRLQDKKAIARVRKEIAALKRRLANANERVADACDAVTIAHAELNIPQKNYYSDDHGTPAGPQFNLNELLRPRASPTFGEQLVALDGR